MVMPICSYMPTVFLDGHSRRTLHGVWMSRTAAVRALRTRASGTHSSLRVTGADLLRNPGPLSSVSALKTLLLPFSAWKYHRRRGKATSGNLRRSGVTHFQLLIFLSPRSPCPPSAFLYAYEWPTRTPRKTSGGESSLTLLFSSKWESVSRKHRVRLNRLAQSILCRNDSRL